MRKQFVSVACVVCGAVVLLAAPHAPAGPVSLVSGRSVISFNMDSEGSARISSEVDIRFPGSADFIYDGDGGPNSPGVGRVIYTSTGSDTRASFDVNVLSAHNGAPFGINSASEFIVSFATDRALRYHLEGTLLGVSVFEVGLDDFTARAVLTLRPGDDSIRGGNWPLIQEERGHSRFGELDRVGLLPAGTHFLSVRAEAGLTDQLAQSSAGMIRLALARDPEPLPIPLPPAIWAGLGTLGASIGLSRLRRLQSERPRKSRRGRLPL